MIPKPDFNAMDGVHPKTDDFVRLQNYLEVMVGSLASMFDSGILYGLEPTIVGSDIKVSPGAFLIKAGNIVEIVKIEENEIIIKNGATSNWTTAYLYKKVNNKISVVQRTNIVGVPKVVAYADMYDIYINSITPEPDLSISSVIYRKDTNGRIVKKYALGSLSHEDSVLPGGIYTGPKLNADKALQEGSVTNRLLAENSINTIQIMDKAITFDKLSDDISNFNLPLGSILPYAGFIYDLVDEFSIFQGIWMICDGRKVKIKTPSNPNGFLSYELFRNWNWGANFIDNTCTLPDLRNVFLRGAYYGREFLPHTRDIDPFVKDPGPRVSFNGSTEWGGVGSYERDTFKKHTHNIRLLKQQVTGLSATKTIDFVANALEEIRSGLISETGDDETRPANAAVNFIIKVRNEKISDFNTYIANIVGVGIQSGRTTITI